MRVYDKKSEQNLGFAVLAPERWKTLKESGIAMPPGNSGGGLGRTDQLYAWSRVAAIARREEAEKIFDVAVDYCTAWSSHLNRDAWNRDEGHFFLAGVIEYQKVFPAHAHHFDNLIFGRGERSLQKLREYNQDNFGEPALFGGAIRNCVSLLEYYLDHQGILRDDIKNELSRAIRGLYHLPVDGLGGFDINHHKQGWITKETYPGVPCDILILPTNSRYWPSQTGYWHIHPTHMFSNLPYAILETLPYLLPQDVTMAFSFLARLRRMAYHVTKGFRNFGPKDQSRPVPVLDWDKGDVADFVPTPEEFGSGQEEVYSFRWLSDAMRPGANNFQWAYQPHCLDVKQSVYDWYRAGRERDDD